MKKARLPAAALALLLACPAAAQQAILWLPADGRPDPAILELLEKDPALKLSAAFSELPKTELPRVLALEKAGRLELALRPYGDPPLPLLYSPASEGVVWAGKPSTATLANDQYFMALRLGLARDAAYKDLKKAVPGLAVPPGGPAPDYFPLARAMGVKWLACGPLLSTAAAAAEYNGVLAAPFVRASTSAPAGPPPPFTVFDETLETDPTALRAALAAELSAPAAFPRLTVSEALALSSAAPAAEADLPALCRPWSGDYSALASAPAQAGALAALAKTRADLMLHLNAQQANYKAASPAFEQYFSAEAGAPLLALGRAGTPEAQEAEAAVLTALANAYRLMNRPPPLWALASLTEASGPAEQQEKLRITVSGQAFEIVNVPRAPELPPGLRAQPGTDPQKLWKLAALKAEAGEDAIKFSFTPGELQAPGPGGQSFGQIRLDLYIDINHRPRAGMSRPLEGRPLRLFPDNAWEYALEISPGRAVLYKATPRGPEKAGVFVPRAEGGAVTVRIPRTALRGNPLLWGYAALLLAPRDARNFAITDYIAAEVSNGYIYAARPVGK